MRETLLNGIEREPGICGGEACIAHTRIPVWLLALTRRFGADHARILKDYPGISEQDLENARAYADAYPDEIEHAIAANERD